VQRGPGPCSLRRTSARKSRPVTFLGSRRRHQLGFREHPTRFEYKSRLEATLIQVVARLVDQNQRQLEPAGRLADVHRRTSARRTCCVTNHSGLFRTVLSERTEPDSSIALRRPPTLRLSARPVIACRIAIGPGRGEFSLFGAAAGAAAAAAGYGWGWLTNFARVRTQRSAGDEPTHFGVRHSSS